MAALTYADLVLLDNFIYLDGFAAAYPAKLEYLIKKLRSGKVMAGRKQPSADAAKQWERLLDLAGEKCRNAGEGLAGLLLVGSVGGDALSGLRAAAFLDPEDWVTVVLRGTANEWRDNGEGAVETDTRAQEEALLWYDALMDHVKSLWRVRGITVTGHSKGGNKAQYLAAASVRHPADFCLSLDGQGFGEDFIEKYRERIKAVSGRIVSLCAKNDFVHALLNPIAGTTLYVETEFQKNFAMNHAPWILLDKNGDLYPFTAQGEVPKAVHSLVQGYLELLPEPCRSYVVDGLMSLMMNPDFEQPASREQQKKSVEIAIDLLPEALYTNFLVKLAGEGDWRRLEEKAEPFELLFLTAITAYWLSRLEPYLLRLVSANMGGLILSYLESLLSKAHRDSGNILEELAGLAGQIEKMADARQRRQIGQK